MRTPPIDSGLSPAAPFGSDGTSRQQRWLRSAARTLGRREVALPGALLLVLVIAAGEYVTGYEVRLALLYVLPVGYATWVCGRGMGFLVALLGPVIWAATFSTRHHYRHDIYFYWDGIVLATTLVLFVELLARLHEALARSDERFVRVLDELYAAVYVADEHGNALFANRRLLELMGSRNSPPAVCDVEARFSALKAEPTQTRDSPDAFREREVRDVTQGHWYVLREGDIPWIGRRRARLKMLTDVTHQKRAQSMQRQHEEALRHTSRLMDLAEASTTVAHELNQPLLAIVSYTAACIRLMEAGGDPKLLRDALEKCRAQAVRAGEIMRRLRELTSRRSPHREACDLNAMIRQTLGWCEPAMEHAQVSVDLALSEPAPSVQADRVLIEQVIWNLVQNAIDAMRAHDGARRVLGIRSAAEGDAAKISVSDTGPGISDDVAERLYAPFFSTKSGGLGLGLSICRSVVEMHGGRIWHSANDAGGVTFHFILPYNSA